MAITSAGSGTQTAILTTEHTLVTLTSAGVYVINVDAAALANGETLTLRAKVKTLSGGTSRLAYVAVFQQALGQPSLFSIPIPALIEVVFTLRQDGGVGRSYPWNVIQLQ